MNQIRLGRVILLCFVLSTSGAKGQSILEAGDTILEIAQLDTFCRPFGDISVFADDVYGKVGLIDEDLMSCWTNKFLVEFIINQKGVCETVTMLNGTSCPEINKILLSGLDQDLQWEIGTSNGQPVMYRYLLPLYICLSTR